MKLFKCPCCNRNTNKQGQAVCLECWAACRNKGGFHDLGRHEGFECEFSESGLTPLEKVVKEEIRRLRECSLL